MKFNHKGVAVIQQTQFIISATFANILSIARRILLHFSLTCQFYVRVIRYHFAYNCIFRYDEIENVLGESSAEYIQRCIHNRRVFILLEQWNSLKDCKNVQRKKWWRVLLMNFTNGIKSTRFTIFDLSALPRFERDCSKRQENNQFTVHFQSNNDPEIKTI